tara:strand:+ start:360 stop:536 length:177 start_codon:yes stop_codon:yes gene_type:complete
MLHKSTEAGDITGGRVIIGNNGQCLAVLQFSDVESDHHHRFRASEAKGVQMHISLLKQ